jgi:glutathione S-transferase
LNNAFAKLLDKPAFALYCTDRSVQFRTDFQEIVMNKNTAGSRTLYRHPLSGHCHRVELFLSLLKIEHASVDVDLMSGAQRQPDFLALNPMGQVPVFVDGDTVLTDSTAILVYLALRYAPESWLPRDPVGAASVQRFLSLAAGEIYRGPAMARLIRLLNLPNDYATAETTARTVLGYLDACLAQQRFLAGDHATIADIAAYSYIARAPEGDISLAPYGNVRAWLSVIEGLPGFVPMQVTRLPAAA